MNPDQTSPRTIDEYILGFPPEIQEILQKIRQTIRNAAPEAVETIKYNMPTFTLNGNLVYFAAYKKHIGFYPMPTGSEEFNRALAFYKAEKSTIQFPLSQPIPYDLISQIVALRVEENVAHAAAKGKKKG